MAERRVFNGIGKGRNFKTGRYVYDKNLKKLILARDRAGESTSQAPMIMPDIKEFVTDNITGEPVVVHGRRQKKALMKQHNVVEYEPTLKDKRDIRRKESEKIVADFKKGGTFHQDVKVGWKVQ